MENLDKKQKELIKEIIERVEKLNDDGFDEIKRYIDICSTSKLNSVDVSFCFYCNSSKIRIHSKTKSGNTRFWCNKCKRTFSESKLNFIGSIKKSKQDKFIKFIPYFLNMISIEKIANELNVSLKTIFRWRHKLLNLISNNSKFLIENKQLEGIVEMDEKFLPLIEKGSRNIKRTPRIRGYRSFDFTQKRKRGLSKDKICLSTIIDRNKNFACKILGFGKPNKESLTTFILKILILIIVIWFLMVIKFLLVLQKIYAFHLKFHTQNLQQKDKYLKFFIFKI